MKVPDVAEVNKETIGVVTTPWVINKLSIRPGEVTGPLSIWGLRGGVICDNCGFYMKMKRCVCASCACSLVWKGRLLVFSEHAELHAGVT